MARVKKGVKVIVESTKYFSDKAEARAYAINVLGTGTTFVSVDMWEEEEDDPEPVEPKPITTPGYPKMITAKKVPKPGRKIKRSKFRYPDGLRNFCIKNIEQMKNPELLEAANKQFDLDLDYQRLVSYMKYNNIKRSEVIHQQHSKSSEKQLKTLPPEDNF